MSVEITPGPWKAEMDKFDQMIVESENGDFVTLLVPDDNENYIEDARLIAAAPEMMHALERLLRSLEEVRFSHEFHEAFKECKDVVAKAKGGANERN